MKRSRRNFLRGASGGLLSAAAGGKAQVTNDLPPGAPPAFNTAPAVGPVVSPTTFTQAEKLMQVELTPTQRSMAARSWRTSMASLYERRTGPRKIELESTAAPWSNWNPVLPESGHGPAQHNFVRSKVDPG